MKNERIQILIVIMIETTDEERAHCLEKTFSLFY